MTPTSHLKIGIIDSGIDVALLRATDIKITAGANFWIDWSERKLNSAFYQQHEIEQWRHNHIDIGIADVSGHGTAVASILHRHITRPVEFYIAKILDEKISGSAICLLEAMRWLLNSVGTDYINLSLGTDNWQWHSSMDELTKQARQQNCHIFSAAGDIPTLPSQLAGVTAVGTSQLAKNNKAFVKLDCVAIVETTTVYSNNLWQESELTTSYASPLLLAQHCQGAS